MLQMLQLESDIKTLPTSALTPIVLETKQDEPLYTFLADIPLGLSEIGFSGEAEGQYLSRLQALYDNIDSIHMRNRRGERVELHFFGLEGIGYIEAATLIIREGFQLGTLHQALSFMDLLAASDSRGEEIFSSGSLIPMGSANLPENESELLSVGNEISLPVIHKNYGCEPYIFMTHPHSFSKYRSNLFLGYRNVS